MMETRNYARSVDHVNWWEPEHWKAKAPRSVSSLSLEGADPADIRNGWLTLPDKARFQQKQLQERELKIASLYEAQQARALDRVRHSPSNGASKTAAPQGPPLSVNPGKVRQMFEERRTKAGIDKSYPLQPIPNSERRKPPPPATSGPNKATHYTNGVTKTKPQTNGPAKSMSNTNSRVTEKKQVTNSTTRVGVVRKTKQKVEALVNGSGDLNHNHELDLNKNIKQSSNGEMIPGIDALDGAENNYLLENETPPPALAASPPPPRSPSNDAPRRPPRRSGIKDVHQGKSPQPQPVAPPRKASSDFSVSSNSRPKKGMQCSDNDLPRRRPVLSGSRVGVGAVRAARASPKTAAAGATLTAPSGDPCKVCGRRFAPDRLQRHEEICRNTQTKKRKPFDVLKHRLAGTEAEQYINKFRRQGNSSSTTKVSKPLNNNWRQKHEEFIAAIRAAKQVQAHINAGGKLSDLPPPPRSENPDYVQCPHCQRRFNESAAARHIPKCASYQFNKPKAGPAGKNRR